MLVAKGSAAYSSCNLRVRSHVGGLPTAGVPLAVGVEVHPDRGRVGSPARLTVVTAWLLEGRTDPEVQSLPEEALTPREACTPRVWGETRGTGGPSVATRHLLHAGWCPRLGEAAGPLVTSPHQVLGKARPRGEATAAERSMGCEQISKVPIFKWSPFH